MTPLVMTIVVVPLVLMIGAIAVGRLVGHIPASIGVSMWIGTITLIIVSVLAGVLLYAGQHDDYEACRTAVDGRNGLRRLEQNRQERWTAIQTEINELAGGNFHLTSIDEMIAGIGQDLEGLPPRSYDECAKPLTFGW